MTRNVVSDGDSVYGHHWNSLFTALEGDGVVSGLTPSKGTGDWDVDYTAGTAQANGVTVEVSSGTVTLSAAPASDDRVDIITVDSSGTVSATAGTANPTGSVAAPNIPSNEVLIAVVHLRGGSSSLQASDIEEINAYPQSASLQGPQDVSASRAFGTWYQNTSGFPLIVSVTADATDDWPYTIKLTGHVNSSAASNAIIGAKDTFDGSSAKTGIQNVVLHVPDDWYYKAVADSPSGRSITYWVEQEMY